ncbi:hypothetical protein K431DRAFT_292248 [Polychaeton citri CBS 116435]|uniref:Zn(2)-C6 fungal-type domain-containing protein n=1 Tax=Polychaeton citri CBS 116435 TaxID=1314669 RepID=A0A9P4QFV8_9PEZI|nr:hypothetical protein K431DRAFT_292248 [Polychaeton citri CBS 116435]
MDTDPVHAKRTAGSSSSAGIQVCDRCRFKKIKCDGQRPVGVMRNAKSRPKLSTNMALTPLQCSNCRNSNFPCETRARLARNATPRSYVQYLEARIRQLEDQQQTGRSSPREAAPAARRSPYGDRTPYAASSSIAGSSTTSNNPIKDWTALRELGSHVIDEDGFSHYLGPSSGVGFASYVLHDLMTEEQQNDPRLNTLFTLDDFNRNRTLENMDQLLWSVNPIALPDRRETDFVLNHFFAFTQRLFPVLHKPSFLSAVDQLYSLDNIGVESFELLAQFYFALAIGNSYLQDYTHEERVARQVRAIETGLRCHFTTFHTRRDGLTRLQTLALHSYALALLRQRSEALRISSMANTKALECGLHHDGNRGAGNPLEQQMRRRVFWSVFMLHLYLTSLAGLPRLLHEADITIAEPDNIDDEQLTTTEVLNNALPGRTRIHRFVSSCRLVRILSRCLDVLYTANKRKQASTKIEHMSRLCCDHLLDQLDFNFTEIPSDVPDPDAEGPEQLATLSSYVNEQLLFYYIRWLIYRPGLAIDHSDPFFSTCLQMCTSAAASLLKVMHKYRRVTPMIKANPAAHPMTVFITALTPLYRATLMQSVSAAFSPNLAAASRKDHLTVWLAVEDLYAISRDSADDCRRDVLQTLMVQVFGSGRPEAARASPGATVTTSTSSGAPLFSTPFSQPAGPPADSFGTSSTRTTTDVQMDYQRQRLEQLAAHDDLRSFVHEAFSPSLGEIWDDADQGFQ